MSVRNQGLVKHRVTKFVLRVRGIQNSAALNFWGDTQRVDFPVKVVDNADVIYHQNYGSVFVEPGVTQRLTFVAKVPEGIRFVVARAQFNYDPHSRWPRKPKPQRTHSTERVFEVNVAGAIRKSNMASEVR